MCRFSFGCGSCDGLWRVTLGTELAAHRSPDSPRRIRVPRCHRDIGRHGYWLRGPLRPSRRDNPVTRVSVTLSTESQPSCRNPGIRCAATLLAASRTFERKLLKPRSWAVPARCQESASSNTWVRQLCAKGQIRRSHQRSRRRRVDRPVRNPVRNPPTANRPRRDRTASPWPVGCVEPSHQSVNNPLTRVSATLSRTLSETLQLQVRHNVRELDHASPPATTAGEEHRNDTLLRGLLTLW